MPIAELEPEIQVAMMPLAQSLGLLANRRDSEAWEALLAHCGDDILRLTRRILGDAELAEDACQETLLQIREYAGDFRPPAVPRQAEFAARVWIMRIAGNTAMNMSRSRSRALRRDERAAEKPPRDESNPAERQVKKEQAELLHREVAGLPQTLREPVMLRYFGEMDYPELATALNCSPDAAKKRVQRGLDRLRSRLAVFGIAFSVADLGSRLTHSASVHAAEAAAGAKALSAGSQVANAVAWKALLLSTAAPAMTGVVPIVGGLSLMAKISLSVAALIVFGTGAAVVHKSFAEDAEPKVNVSSNVPVVVKVTSGGVTTVTQVAPDPNAANATVAGNPKSEEKPAPAAPVADEPWMKEMRETTLKKKIDFDFADTPLTEAVDFLSTISGVKINIDTNSQAAARAAKITLKVQEMEIGAALKMMTGMADLKYELRDKAILIVRDASKPAAGANPGNAAVKLNVNVGPGGLAPNANNGARPNPAAGANAAPRRNNADPNVPPGQ